MLVRYYDSQRDSGMLPFARKQLERNLDLLHSRGAGLTILEEQGGFVLHVYFRKLTSGFEYYPPGDKTRVLVGHITTDELRNALAQIDAGQRLDPFLQECSQARWEEPG